MYVKYLPYAALCMKFDIKICPFMKQKYEFFWDLAKFFKKVEIQNVISWKPLEVSKNES